MTSVPTQGEIFARLSERVKYMIEDAAMMAHLTRAQGSKKDHALADGWIAMAELFKRMDWQITQMAKGKLQ